MTKANSGGSRGRKNPKTKPEAPGADGDPTLPPKDHNGKPQLTPDETRALFLRDKDALKIAEDKLAAATADVRNVRKRIKADGFTVAQVKAAIAMETPEGEAKVRAEIGERLQAAMWVGVPWGAQLEMFEQPDRTPAVDRAYDEGKMAGMEGRVRRPPYSPETPQHERWITGYYEGQKVLSAGVGTGPLSGAVS